MKKLIAPLLYHELLRSFFFFRSAQIADEKPRQKKARALLHSWSGIIFLPINYLAAICQTLPSIALRAPSASVASDRSSSLQSARAERAVGLASFQAQSFRSFVVLRYSRTFRRFAAVRVTTYACVHHSSWWGRIFSGRVWITDRCADPAKLTCESLSIGIANETFRSHRQCVSVVFHSLKIFKTVCKKRFWVCRIVLWLHSVTERWDSEETQKVF